MSSETTPSKIGPYEVLRVLGRGGFGTVFLGVQAEPVRREVAIKLLNPGMDAAEIRRRFEVERETLNLMKHPGISMLLDAGVTAEGEPFFAMEYVPGVPIGEYIEREKLPLEQRLALFREVCDAVQHAHNKGIIHRDLTANNVLVMEVDGQPLPKIIDFGIAKSLGDNLVVSMQTSHGQAMGTPTYMSPEQARGDIAQIDTRTDIYALGAMLYLLLTGTLPFTAAQLQEAGVRIFELICDEDPELPSVRRAKLSDLEASSLNASQLRGELDWITAKALSKERNQRYASVAEMSADLARFLGNEPVIAGPPTTWYRVKKALMRHRGFFMGLSAVMLALIIGLIVSIRLWFESSANAQEAGRHLARFNNLSDVLLLETLRTEVDDLGPGHPENVGALDDWLGRAEPLVARLPDLEALLEKGSPTELRTPAELAAQSFLTRELSTLIEDLEEFATSPKSPLANVRARRAWADVVHERTVSEHQTAWNAAIASVANDERFQGFELRPRTGLVPLGCDLESRLPEFLLLRSGRVPLRSQSTGRLEVHEDTGIVLVLVPGGSFEMGAQSEDPHAPQYDPNRKDNEAWYEWVEGKWVFDLLPVTLEPFLISKYEITQAQWERMSAGDRPGVYEAEEFQEYGIVPTVPVENITWARSRQVLREYGMDLPTEAQWEYAARAGTRTPWYSGQSEESLAGHANLADITARDAGVTWNNFAGVTLTDGFVYVSPVGTFDPNPFGLHDVIGNVYEQCLEELGRYAPDLLSGGAALRQSDKAKEGRVIRGGCARYRAVFGRVSYRWYAPPDTANADTGVRPVMSVGD